MAVNKITTIRQDGLADARAGVVSLELGYITGHGVGE